MALDEIDRQIIGELQIDSRISVADLADRINLGPSATSERLRRLRASGIVRRFTIELDPRAIGRQIDAFVDVRFATNYSPGLDFEAPELAAVVEATHLTGRYDLQLRVSATDVAELDRLLEALKDELGAVETNTRLILRTIEGFPRHPPLGD